MAASRDVDAIIREVLTERFTAIEAACGRDVLVVNGPIVPGLDHLVHDALDAIQQRNADAKLAIVLHTGGGVVEVVERIVDTIRHRYKDVVAIIPDRAMSAGTIFAMACDSILMDDFSRLGPIDPQLQRDGKLVPALSYLIQLERLIAKDKAGTLSTPELALISKLDLAELHEFEQAKELSIDLLKKWLTAYKFKDWNVTQTGGTIVTPEMKEKRAEEIARMLSDNARWHSHGRGISRKTLEDDLNLRIDRLEDQADLAKGVRSYHDCLVDNLARIQRPLHVETRSYYT